MDKLQAIRYFQKLGENLSFNGTAQHFGVPASKVSRAIKALEEHLGVTLVERTTRQVRLTETGTLYRDEITPALRSLSAADDLVAEHSQEASGTIRITFPPGYGELRLFKVLEKFRAHYPKVVCDMELSDNYLDLSSGEIDVALRFTHSPPEYLVAKRLHSNRFILVASPNYLDEHGRPHTTTELSKYAALAYRCHQGIMEWHMQSPDGSVSVAPRRPALISNQGMLLLEAALAGEGLALLPNWSVRSFIEEGALEEITFQDAKMVHSAAPATSLYLLYQPEKARLGKIRAMTDFLISSLREDDQPEEVEA